MLFVSSADKREYVRGNVIMARLLLRTTAAPPGGASGESITLLSLSRSTHPVAASLATTGRPDRSTPVCKHIRRPGQSALHFPFVRLEPSARYLTNT